MEMLLKIWKVIKGFCDVPTIVILLMVVLPFIAGMKHSVQEKKVVDWLNKTKPVLTTIDTGKEFRVKFARKEYVYPAIGGGRPYHMIALYGYEGWVYKRISYDNIR